MRTFAIAGLAALMPALTGCVLSIDPVVPDSMAIFDPRLIGSWQEEDGTTRATVRRAEGNTYHIDYVSGRDTSRYVARLGRLGEQMVLDVRYRPSQDDGRSDDDLMVAGHLLLSVDIGTDMLRTRLIDSDTLGTAIRNGVVPLPATRSDKNLVLLGTTPQLRAALQPYLSRPGAWDDPATWKRVR